MNDQVRIVRFNIFDRLFHVFIMVTFLLQAVTGMGAGVSNRLGKRVWLDFLAVIAAPPWSTIR